MLAGGAVFAGALAVPGTLRAQSKDTLRYALSSFPANLRSFQRSDYEDPDATSSLLAGTTPSYQRSFGFENKTIADRNMLEETYFG